MNKRIIAFAAALAMVFSMLPDEKVGGTIAAKAEEGVRFGDSSSVVENEPQNQQLTVDVGSQTEHTTASDVGILTQEDESTLAYDPLAQIKEQQSQQEFRENADISEKTILFSVREASSDDKGISYLDDSSALCKEYGLSKLEVVIETSVEGTDDCTEVFYKAEVKTDDIWAMIDKLNSDERIVNAEPDYLWESTASVSSYKVSENEYNHATHFPGLGIIDVWNDLFNCGVSAPGTGTVVAVIDTGVDYEHEDLSGSMWHNPGEIPDNHIDDDNNGYVDDVYGYDFVENDNNPMDDHGHGTHVSGIIAMTKNRVGGVGLAYGSKIMAIKAGQATGSFASSDIAKAIKYAADNGADVINMSFGGTGKSYLVEAALRDASHDCVLIAAAGNDGVPTTDAPADFLYKEDFYPAGYSYVLGVMATNNDGEFASFSNWDWATGVNCEYEMAAPGVGIYSTLPGNRYASWSGTSMAAPNVSAAAAILRSKYMDKNQYTSRFIMGQLVSATDDSTSMTDKLGYTHTYPLLNINDSLTETPSPNVVLDGNIYMFDDPEIAPENNGDGIAQPGETIELGVGVFNYWGTAKDVTITIDALSAGNVPNPHVELLTYTVNIGSVGMFTTSDNGFVYEDDKLTGVSNPLRIKIKEGTANDIQIPINFTITCKNGMDNTDMTVYGGGSKYTYTVTVQNGYAISGVIEEDMTLTNDKYWIIQNNVLIPEGVTVTVEPGTQIQFWSADPANPYAASQDVYIQVEGRFIAEGTEEQPIEMFPGKGYENQHVNITGNVDEYSKCDEGIIDDDFSKSYSLLKYVEIINAADKNYVNSVEKGKSFCVTEVDHCRFNYIDNTKMPGWNNRFYYIKTVSNSVFTGIKSKYSNSYPFNLCLFSFNNCQFDNCFNARIKSAAYGSAGFSYHYDQTIINSVFLNNCFSDNSNECFVEYQWYSINDETTVLNNAFLSQIQMKNPEQIRMIDAKTGHQTYDISGNYWGTTDPDLVKIQCYDADWNISLDQLVQEPYLTLEDDMSAIYPFVTEAYLTDKDGNRIDTVNGRQQVSLHVKFNRDMAQDIQPMVTYGGSEPYTDYMPSGDWVGNREWRADFTITPDYEMGRMYIRVKGAAAADDRWLVTGEDSARFFFTVTNTGAQAMTLQGEGLAGENSLSWIQDDYDTLAGYNLYRSTDPDQQGYTRINSSLLSPDELSYTDENVEPSVDYYYYFTVMDTDMHESKASNVVVCTPTESEPPVITHTPITSCTKGDTVVFTASITDNVAVTGATLHYRFKNSAAWGTLNMNNTSGTNYRAQLNAYAAADIEYYITATDGTNTGYFGTQQEPYTISCKYLTSIEITSLPDKLNYTIGEDFDSTGIVVTANYSDNSSVVLDESDYDIYDDDYDSQTVGTYTIYVEYGVEEVEFDVYVTNGSEPTLYTITFNTDGGSNIAPIIQEPGTAVTAPEPPTKEGFAFVGWDTDIPTVMPAQSITITAQWSEVVDISNGTLDIDPITFRYNGKQKTVSDITVTVGTTVLDEDDYDVAGNTGTEAGTYTLTVTGKGKYKGSLSAQWKIANMHRLTTTIGEVTTTTFYEENTTATFKSTGVGGWFINGTLRSIRNTLAFTVLGDSQIEWVEGDYGNAAVVNLSGTDRYFDSETNKWTVEFTMVWSLPEGAQLQEAGIARTYIEVGESIPDKETVYASNSKQISTLKTGNGTYQTYVRMGDISAAKTLCAVAYVRYTVNGQEKLVIADDVFTSAPV